jgi:hypothetical protein
MSVYFHCPKADCGMIFGATREKRTKQQNGTFNCTVCESEVLTWSDAYDYVDWLMVTKRPAARTERQRAEVSSGQQTPVPHG